MVYLMSDVHGDFRSFSKMLDGKINFSDADQLYILGDAIDRGKENLRLLKFIGLHTNIYLLKGNHELFLELYLDGVLPGWQWDAWGGAFCRAEVEPLSLEKKKALKNYLTSLPYYKELEVDGEITICTHTGLDEDFCQFYADGRINIRKSIGEATENNPFGYLISSDIHDIAEKAAFDFPLVTGHVPTIWITGKAKIYRHKRFMDIDTGNGYRDEGGKLCCYCADNGAEFYI